MSKLNLFKMMPTTRSEDLSSAVLVYLLDQGDTFAEALAEQLNLEVDGDICSIESVSEFTFSGKGRVDILVKTGRRVYAIENKLTADFGPNQLQNYKDGLRQLEGAEGASVAMAKLIALVPERLKAKAAQTADAVVTWESLLQSSAFGSEPEIWRNLKEFVGNLIGLYMPKIDWAAQEKSILDSHKHFVEVFAARYFSGMYQSDRGTGGLYTGMYLRNNEHDKYAQCYLSIQLGESPELDKTQPQFTILTHASADLSRYFTSQPLDQRYSTWKKYETDNLGQDYKIWQFKFDKGHADWQEVGNYTRQEVIKKHRLN